ncbi:hypothetical protein Daus18300_000733 [Diaporthe australafricana]|uniref:Uncharacterized protein n=1 Tax=Diaporthe australafricana TaxID=127596 RepID=A0ABR3Y2Y8_9PEZI
MTYIGGCTAASINGTASRNTAFNNDTTASQFHHFDSGTTASHRFHPASGCSATFKLDLLVGYTTASEPGHSAGDSTTNNPDSFNKSRELGGNRDSTRTVDVLYLFNFPVIVDWIDECSGRGRGRVKYRDLVIDSDINRIHGGCRNHPTDRE